MPVNYKGCCKCGIGGGGTGCVTFWLSEQILGLELEEIIL